MHDIDMEYYRGLLLNNMIVDGKTKYVMLVASNETMNCKNNDFAAW